MLFIGNFPDLFYALVIASASADDSLLNSDNICKQQFDKACVIQAK